MQKRPEQNALNKCDVFARVQLSPRLIFLTLDLRSDSSEALQIDSQPFIQPIISALPDPKSELRAYKTWRTEQDSTHEKNPIDH